MWYSLEFCYVFFRPYYSAANKYCCFASHREQKMESVNIQNDCETSKKRTDSSSVFTRSGKV